MTDKKMSQHLLGQFFSNAKEASAEDSRTSTVKARRAQMVVVVVKW